MILAHSPACSYFDAIDMKNLGNSDYKEVLTDGMRRTFSALTQANKKVIVLLDNPPLPYDPTSCVERPFRITKKNDQCSFPREQFDNDKALTDYRTLVKTVTKDFPNIETLDLSTQLCDEQRCYLSKNGSLLYLDRSHLNAVGSKYVAPYLINTIDSIN